MNFVEEENAPFTTEIDDIVIFPSEPDILPQSEDVEDFVPEQLNETYELIE